MTGEQRKAMREELAREVEYLYPKYAFMEIENDYD
jgi:hypothetical protein